MSDKFQRIENENDFEYKARLLKYKLEDKEDIDWQEIVNLLQLTCSSDHLRKTSYGFVEAYNHLKTNNVEIDIEQNKETTEEISTINNYRATIELNKDGSQTSDKLIQMSENDCKDVKFLLSAHGYDSKIFELVSARNNIWNSYSKKDGIMTLYSSKIVVKPRVNDISIEEIQEWFREFDRQYKTVKSINYKHKDGELLFEFPLVDLHYGKKGYIFEVGKETNSDSTEDNFFKIIYDFKDRLKDKLVSKIVFPIGNDLFNSDTIDNSTTKGTRQDNDMRWKELFKSGLQMIIQGIDILSEIAPVDLIYVEGNHDTMTTYHLFIALQSHYRKDESVNVIDSSLTRQYYQWGKCLIGYSHGDSEGKRINGLMQKEQPKLWGETMYREWHLAHLHHEIAKEDNGLVIRHLPTITGTDAWHYKSGYVGALQRCQAFIWDKQKGLQDILFSTIN